MGKPVHDGTALPGFYDPAPDLEPDLEADLDVSSMTVAEVLAAVDSGDLAVADAVAQERAGKGRVTILNLES